MLILGGCIDKADVVFNRKSTKAKFLRNTIDEEEEVDDDTTNPDQWMVKAAILFPISLFCSQQILDLCKLTGANLFHLADKETPSTMSLESVDPEPCKNSTRVEGSQAAKFDLQLSEIISGNDGLQLSGFLSSSADNDTLLFSNNAGMVEYVVNDITPVNPILDLSESLCNITPFNPDHSSTLTYPNSSLGTVHEAETPMTSSNNTSSNCSQTRFGNEESLSKSSYTKVSCDACGLNSTISGISRHKCPNKLANHNCQKCERKFITIAGLKKHNLIEHTRPSNSRSHLCTVCSRPFLTQGGLKKHMKVHETFDVDSTRSQLSQSDSMSSQSTLGDQPSISSQSKQCGVPASVQELDTSATCQSKQCGRPPKSALSNTPAPESGLCIFTHICTFYQLLTYLTFIIYFKTVVGITKLHIEVGHVQYDFAMGGW